MIKISDAIKLVESYKKYASLETQHVIEFIIRDLEYHDEKGDENDR
jgi:hypothetical protein